MMKKTCFLLILIALLISLSGCTGIENALHEAGEKIQSNQVETPQNNGGDIDWSFVPVVREKVSAYSPKRFRMRRSRKPAWPAKTRRLTA